MGVVEVKSLPDAMPSPARETPLQASVVDLRGVGHVLKRRWRWIAAASAGTALLVLLATFLMPPKYQASSLVIFDPRNLQVLQNDLRAESPNGDDVGAQVESQVQVITSASVLGRVVDHLHLADDPDFGAPRPTLLSTLTGAIGGIFGGAAPPADRSAVALRKLRADVAVRRTDKTLILEVLATTPDPDESARIANAVTDAFLDELADSRADATRRSGEQLGGRVDELRARLARSEAAVEVYRAQHDLVGADNKPVIEQQITDINNQLALARTRVAEQEARRDDIARLARRGDAFDAVSEANLSPAIAMLKQQLTTAQQAENEARLTYGARHPAMAAAASQVQTVRQRLNAEVGRLALTAGSDLDRVRASEKLLEQRLDALKRQDAGTNDDLVRLRELERQAASDRGVYETYLNRAKDLQERETLDTVNARVLSPAVPPVSKSNPSRSLLALGGLLVGALLGTGAGLVREQLDDRIRSVRQIGAETRVPVVARLAGDLGLNDPGLWSLRDQLSLGDAAWKTRVAAFVGVGLGPERPLLFHDLVRATEADGTGALLVDADDERGDLSRLLGCGNRRGLAELVASPAGLPRDTLRPIGAARFLPAGQARAGLSGQGRELRALLDGLSREGRLVVIYGGAARATARLRTLAAVADDVYVVAESGRATLRELRAALDGFGPEVRRLRGIVLVGPVEDA